MKHAIVTASDKKYGDFLINHWLVSLKENVNLKNIDVIVLDYGLLKDHVLKLKKADVIVIKCLCDGHVTSLRYRDLITVLEKCKYDQILMIDSGDIIFQADISDLFEKNKEEWRAVEECLSVKFDQLYQLKIKDIKLRKEIINSLKGKNAINGGFVLGPASEFMKFCRFYLESLKDLDSYGVDQVLITYYLSKNSFIKLDLKYNFLLLLKHAKHNFYIRNNKFYNTKSELIYVVHNCGRFKFFRGMSEFGYNIKARHNFTVYFFKIGTTIFNLLISILNIFIQLPHIFHRNRGEK